MYRLSVYSSPITFPLCFALHTWVVLESPEHGTNRYEIHVFKNKSNNTYFYKNNQPQQEGMSVFSIPGLYLSKKKFKSVRIYQISGDQYKNIILDLEKKIQEYSHKNIYKLYPGPNSNTFTRWVLSQNNETKNTPLPWNAFGKNFKF